MNTETLDYTSFIRDELESSLAVKRRLFEDSKIIESVASTASLVAQAYRNGNKTILAGNGGSAADAQHIAGEFVSRFYYDRPALPSISLSTDPSIVTAIANDYGYEKLFVRQIDAHGQKGDVFFAISTSGASKNILSAMKRAKELGMKVIALSGEKARETEMIHLADISILAPSTSTPKIQECHIVIGHAICAAVERSLFTKPQ